MNYPKDAFKQQKKLNVGNKDKSINKGKKC